jgi:hypothetical protein
MIIDLDRFRATPAFDVGAQVEMRDKPHWGVGRVTGHERSIVSRRVERVRVRFPLVHGSYEPGDLRAAR